MALRLLQHRAADGRGRSSRRRMTALRFWSGLTVFAHWRRGRLQTGLA